MTPTGVAVVVGILGAGLNAGLVAWLVRPRGRVAMAIAGGALALFPLLALAGCELARSGRRAGWLAAGATVGFGLPCLPFLVLAPSRFVHDVVLDQARRGSHGYAAVSLGSRLVELVDGRGRGAVGRPPYPRALVATWRADLAAAKDVVVVDQGPRGDIPWTPSLRRWFVGHFSVALIEQDAVVYARRPPAGP